MIEDFKKILIDYLSLRIDKVLLVKLCKELYVETIKSSENNFVLDYIIAIPFIHEMAYCKYTSDETTKKASYFLSVLNHKIVYHYAGFFQLPHSTGLNSTLYRLNCSNFKLQEIASVFNQHIDTPKTIYDVLSNTIFSLLSNVNYMQINESSFSYVNCPQINTFEPIERRVRTLLSYLLGYKPFYIHLSYCVDEKVIYTII